MAGVKAQSQIAVATRQAAGGRESQRCDHLQQGFPALLEAVEVASLGQITGRLQDALIGGIAVSPAITPARPGLSSLVNRIDIVSGRGLSMGVSRRRIIFQAGVVFSILLWATAIAPEPPARISISPGELVRAVTIGRQSLIDLCLMLAAGLGQENYLRALLDAGADRKRDTARYKSQAAQSSMNPLRAGSWKAQLP